LLVVGYVIDEMVGKMIRVQTDNPLHIAAASNPSEELITPGPKLDIEGLLAIMLVHGFIKRWDETTHAQFVIVHAQNMRPCGHP
jgi:hypothetical protein